MRQLKVVTPQGLNDIPLAEAQALEQKLDLAFSVINYERVGTSKLDNSIELHYQKQLNGAQPS